MHAKPFSLPVPRGWPSRVKSAMRHVLSLAQCATAYTRSWAAVTQRSEMHASISVMSWPVKRSATF